MTKAVAFHKPPPVPNRYHSGDGSNSTWKISVADHEAALERARDEERLSIIQWLNDWSIGRSFTEQGVASLILKDLLEE